ncbi:hypothetical protein [Fischerella sp. PCC 9605]|uniref:hypothetical protein n=1 Tax=Fischerella sp. PCC 9605 TaxID=1173024 RepID=UPI00047BDCC3|nr:hypothetical protein [Fischerella sp. PCC 9605]
MNYLSLDVRQLSLDAITSKNTSQIYPTKFVGFNWRISKYKRKPLPTLPLYLPQSSKQADIFYYSQHEPEAELPDFGNL